MSTFSIPVGTVINYAAAALGALPDNWVLCDGRTLDTSQYQELHDALGLSGNAPFQIPDLQGRFLRGMNEMLLLSAKQAKPDIRTFNGQSSWNLGSFHDC